MTKKEKGAVPFESAPASNTSAANSTRIARLKTIAADHPGNDVEVQRDRVLTAMQEGSLSTVEARRHLDVMHPAMRVLELRVLELRAIGLRIDTVWSLEPTECGRLHRMARYVLRVGVAG